MALPQASLRSVLYGAALIAAGLALHQFKDVSQVFWISKVMATPAWCLISGGLTAIVWAVLLLFVDRPDGADGRRSSRSPASRRCSSIWSLRCSVRCSRSRRRCSAERTRMPRSAAISFGARLRSIVFAWVVVRLAGWLRTRGLRLRL